MITRETLDEIEARLAKGWVIRRDQIEALVTMCRSHPAVVAQPEDPNANKEDFTLLFANSPRSYRP